MARIKNWKKTRSDKYAQVWVNKKTQKIVAVQKGIFHTTLKKKWDAGYSSTARGAQSKARKLKTKTTKAQALKSARRYMRSRTTRR